MDDKAAATIAALVDTLQQAEEALDMLVVPGSRAGAKQAGRYAREEIREALRSPDVTRVMREITVLRQIATLTATLDALITAPAPESPAARVRQLLHEWKQIRN